MPWPIAKAQLPQSLFESAASRVGFSELVDDSLMDLSAIFAGAIIPGGEVPLKTSPRNLFRADPHGLDRRFNLVRSRGKLRVPAFSPRGQNVLSRGDVSRPRLSRPRDGVNQGIAGGTE